MTNHLCLRLYANKFPVTCCAVQKSLSWMALESVFNSRWSLQITGQRHEFVHVLHMESYFQGTNFCTFINHITLTYMLDYYGTLSLTLTSNVMLYYDATRIVHILLARESRGLPGKQESSPSFNLFSFILSNLFSD